MLVVLPALAYVVEYGSAGTVGGSRRAPGPSPRAMTLLTSGVGLAFLLYGLVVGGTLFAAADALLIGLAGGLYGARRGVRPIRDRRAAVAAGALLGVVVVAVGAASVVDLGDAVVVGTTVVLGPGVYYALTSERFDRSPRSKRL